MISEPIVGQWLTTSPPVAVVFVVVVAVVELPQTPDMTTRSTMSYAVVQRTTNICI